MVKFSHLEQILNNILTHLVFLRPSIAARTTKETKERSQTRDLIVCCSYMFPVCRRRLKSVSLKSSEMNGLV